MDRHIAQCAEFNVDSHMVGLSHKIRSLSAILGELPTGAWAAMFLSLCLASVSCEKDVPPPAEKPPESLSYDDDAVEGLVKSSLAVTNPAEVERYYALGDYASSDVMDLLADIREKGDLKKAEYLGCVGGTNHPMPIVAVRHGKGMGSDKRLVVLVPGDGQWKVDYEALARVSSPGWGELLQAKEAEGTVRAIFSEDNYFNGPFNDTEWLCYHLRNPDEGQPMFGYCRINSSQHRAMRHIHKLHQQILVTGRDGMLVPIGSRATLKVRKAGPMLNNQFEIIRVLSPEWVVEEVPFDAQAEEPLDTE